MPGPRSLQKNAPSGASLNHKPHRQARLYRLFGKRALDLAFASVGLLAVLLLVPVVWLANGCARASVFYRHLRIGRHGRPFLCLKFRTMVPGAEQLLEQMLQADAVLRNEWERAHKLKKDPRITPAGHFFRRASLDELPQFWNVLMGDMSLVGPRPITAAETRRFAADAEHYLSVRPGITGPWQVSGRSDANYADRVRMDREYATSHSLWVDLKILLATVPAVLFRSGAY